VDFDTEDNEKEGLPPGKSPNAKRKSITPGEPAGAITNVSSLLSTKAAASPATPQSVSTLSPSTPTPAPAIQITSPGSDTKVKYVILFKYKDKLHSVFPLLTVLIRIMRIPK
jgi:hypothetical protein